MADSENSRHHKKVTLEEILRLKRAEKPTLEFWAGFERDLQKRTLQELVRSESLQVKVWRLISSHFYAAFPIAATLVIAALFWSYPSTSKPLIHEASQTVAGDSVDFQGSLNVEKIPPTEFADSVKFMAASDRPLQAHFVKEVMSNHPLGGENFKRILSVEQFTATNESQAVYVADPISGSPSEMQYQQVSAILY